MMLSRLCCVMLGVQMMTVRGVGVVSRLLVVAGLRVLGGHLVVLGGVFVMFGCFLVIFCGHGKPPR